MVTTRELTRQGSTGRWVITLACRCGWSYVSGHWDQDDARRTLDEAWHRHAAAA